MQTQLEGKKPATIYVIMEMLSREYGWTPDQIRSMSYIDVMIYQRIIAKRRAIEKTNQMRNS